MKVLPKVPNDFLGIYIPTYNRKPYLEECLNSFIPQIKPYGFPIFISDNGSSDGTEAMVKKLKRSYPRIFYKNNGKNLGYCKNLINVLHMGNTQYVWTFGDDDAIKSGAIKIIVKNLQKSFDFLQLNCTIYSNDLKKIVESRYIKTSDTIYNKGDHEKAFLNSQHGYAGYMAQIIIRKDLLNLQLKSLDTNAIPLDFLHSILFFRAIVNKKGKFISRPLIKNRSGNDRTGAGTLKLWLSTYPKTLDELSHLYSKKALNENSNFGIKTFVAIANNSRKSYPNNILVYNKEIIRSRINPLYKLILLSVLTLPKPIVNLAISTAKIFTG